MKARFIASSPYFRVYAINAQDGHIIAKLDINDATNYDWEDIAVGPGPEEGKSYIYVGDIGGNIPQPGYAIYRVEEPDVLEDGELEIQSVVR